MYYNKKWNNNKSTAQVTTIGDGRYPFSVEDRGQVMSSSSSINSVDPFD